MPTFRAYIFRAYRRVCGALRWCWRMRGRVVLLAVLLVALAAAYLYADYSRDTPETFYDDPVRQFKYGSTGGDRLAGIPEGIFKALPQLCPEYLPGKGWESLGFVFEEGMDRPVGTSKRYTLGFERIALNCAACHVGTYRETPQSKPVPVAGMPAHQLDLGGFTQFLTQCALDERFNPWQVVQAAERAGAHYSLRQRLLLEYVAVPAMKEALILARFRFRFLDHEVTPGPGRFTLPRTQHAPRQLEVLRQLDRSLFALEFLFDCEIRLALRRKRFDLVAGCRWKTCRVITLIVGLNPEAG